MNLKSYTAGIVNAIKGKPAMITKADLGWTKVAGSTYGEFKSNDYENAFPSITKITNKFMKIKPYAVNGKGERVEKPTPVINALYHPNILNSSVEFREALSLMYLVHPKTHILVWRREGAKILPGGRITAQNIAGFTFMEGVTVVTVGGKNTYTVTTEAGSATYSDDEVITLRGLNPYRINTGGFSATQAASKWTTIDDYIAQYQKGFFKNGAVPSGEFVITAATSKEFNDIVDKMQDKHRGADNNNNIVYTHRPVDQATGKPVQAQIEWIPYAVSNRELSLKDLFEQANKKIDSAFGVPASIRGVGENNNFATARTDQQNFMENVVDPIALKIWTGFTHELNRITGGLGVAIGYDIVIPALADEEKVKEEHGKIRDERVQAWLDKGYSLSSIKKYLDSGDIEDLEIAEVKEEDKDDPDVDEGNEVKNAPDPNDPTDRNGEAKRTNPKAQSTDPSIDAELVPYEQDIERILNSQIDRQVSRATTEVSDIGEATEDEDDSLADELLAILLLLLIFRGNKVYNDGLTLALAGGLDVSTTSKFTGSITDADKQYARSIVKSFNADTAAEIDRLIASSIAAGLTTDEIKAQLANFRESSSTKYRVERFSGNEAWRISEVAGLRAMNQLDDELNGVQRAGTYKTWNVQAGACPICQDYAGISVKVKDQFFGGIDAPPAHVFCRCRLTYTVVKEGDLEGNMEMHCKECDRFLGLTEALEVKDQIKCSNSKCKALATPVVKPAVSASP